MQVFTRLLRTWNSRHVPLRIDFVWGFFCIEKVVNDFMAYSTVMIDSSLRYITGQGGF